VRGKGERRPEREAAPDIFTRIQSRFSQRDMLTCPTRRQGREAHRPSAPRVNGPNCHRLIQRSKKWSKKSPHPTVVIVAGVKSETV
jgi:hypothetical protein